MKKKLLKNLLYTGIAVVLLTTCENPWMKKILNPLFKDNEAEKVYAIGETGPGGGIVFYVDPAGFTDTFTGKTCHYLEAAPENQSATAQWGDLNTLVPDVSHITTTTEPLFDEIGNGRKDTMLIVAHMDTKSITGTAAQLCAAYTGGGKSDWFLPSLGELWQLYENRNDVGNLGTREYLSSSQRSATQSWYVSFSAGNRPLAQKDDSTRYYRAIRAF